MMILRRHRFGRIMALCLFLLCLHQQTPIAATQPVNTDWPAPFYDNARSRFNRAESVLTTPLNATPTTEIHLQASVGDKMRPAPVVTADHLFWYVYNSWVTIGSPSFVVTDKRGAESWRYVGDGLAGGRAAFQPTVVGDIVLMPIDIAHTQRSELLALDIDTGDELWRHPLHVSQDVAQFVVEDNTVYIHWGGSGTHVAALDLMTGQTLWNQEVDTAGYEFASQLALSNTVLVLRHGPYAVGYNSQTGRELWEYELVDFWDHDLILIGETAIVANDHSIEALDTRTGTGLWQLDAADFSCISDFNAQFATDDTHLFVTGLCAETMLALNPTSGGLLWQAPIERTGAYGRPTVVANGRVYTMGTDSDHKSHIHILRAVDGAFEQSFPVDPSPDSETNIVMNLAVANGQLFVEWTGLTDFPALQLSVWGTESTNQTEAKYLPLYDNDTSPITNPRANVELPLVLRDGEYGTEISVAAHVGQSAQFTVYDATGAVYKQVTGEPNVHGNVHFLVPLEYVAAGYNYDIVLANGNRLPLRQIVMPVTPSANVSAVVETDALVWQSPPATITSAPSTLTLNLPATFPAGTTAATLYLQEAQRGIATLEGRRVGNQLLFDLTPNNALNGSFIMTAAAQADKTTAYSPDIEVVIDSAEFPDVRVQATAAIVTQPDGTAQATVYRFERERPVVDQTISADVQIADVSPDPAGFQVTLFVKTPPRDPADSKTFKWEVALRGVDSAGVPTGYVTAEINAQSEGIYVPLFIEHTGVNPITQLEAYGATLAPPTLRALFNTPDGACSPSGGGNSNGGGKKELSFTDRLSFTGEVGVVGEAVAGIGMSGAAYVQRDFHTGQVQACAEAGARIGGGVGAGPMASIGSSINLSGADHQAPAKTGTKFDLSVSAIIGVQLSYTAPDNFGKGGYGSLGLGFSVSPEFKATGGIAKIACEPLNQQRKTDCCSGSRCGGPSPNSPGGEHPDDTHSVVLNRVQDADEQAYWVSILQFARRQGFDELATYARYRLQEAQRLDMIATYPNNRPMTDEEYKVIEQQRVERQRLALEFQMNWTTIQGQFDLLNAIRVNVLGNGYYEQMSMMLDSNNVPNRLIAPDFAPDAIKQSVLVIPTAGLYGLEGDPTFAARLDRFVQQGGTLIVMAQPDDDSVDLLPGTWTQVGYQNDISCWAAAMTPVASHVMLASVEGQVTGHVDGYLTSWPTSAELLLKRSKNDEGAFVYSQLGEGRMIVTNLYEDWGRTVGQSSPQIRALFRDITRWAISADDNIPSTLLNEAVNVPIELVNATDQAVTQVQYRVWDPNNIQRNVGLPAQTIALDANSAVNNTFVFTPTDDEPGLWLVSYELLNAAGETVLGETWGTYFALMGIDPTTLADTTPHSTAPPVTANVTANVQFDQSSYADAGAVGVTLGINVDAPDSGMLKVMLSLGEQALEFEVPAQSQSIELVLSADFSNDGLFFYGIYDAATDQGLYLNTTWVQPSGGSATITPQQPYYAPSDTIMLDVAGTYSGTVQINGADYSASVDVTAADSNASLALPSVLASGPYEVQYRVDGLLQTSRFDVVGPTISVIDMATDRSVVSADDTVNISASVTSDRALAVTVVGTMVDANGNRVPVFERDEMLQVGTQQIGMSVPVETSAAGMVHYEIALVDQTMSSVVYVKAHRYISLDQPQLLGLNVSGGIVSREQPTIGLDLYSPTAQTLVLTILLDGGQIEQVTINVPAGFSTHPLTLPNSIADGGHLIDIEATSGGLTSYLSETIVVGDALPTAPTLFNVFVPIVIR